MKILYSIQGTGNGHLARATEIIPLLNEIADTDILVSGIESEVQLPFHVKYQLNGLSFIFGTKGGINILKTVMKLKPVQLIKDIIKLPVQNYDIILCDFEPVSSWACKVKKKTCIGLSHQNAVLHNNAPKPSKTNYLGKLVLKYYAPANQKYGFHFEQLDHSNFTPVIRPVIRNSIPKNKGHYTVYLPAYSNAEIKNILSSFPETQWEVFSKHSKQEYTSANIYFRPVSENAFTKSFINCKGIICGAGFETPAESIFMGKKLCVIPMKNQYEQTCNAEFLFNLGITVLSDLPNNKEKIGNWLKSTKTIQIEYPDNIRFLLEEIISGQLNKSVTT